MVKSEDERLAMAYGELARGYKRLRQIHLDRAKAAPTPMSECNSMDTSESETKDDDVVSLESSEPPGDPRLNDFFFRSYGITTLDWGATPKEFLLGQRYVFSKVFDRTLVRFLLTDRVRGDRFKNYWLADPEARHGWKKISENQVTGIWSMVCAFHSKVIQLLRCSYEDFTKNVGPIKRYHFGRKELVIDANVELDVVLKFVREEHRRLPSVCGRNVKKKKP